MGDSDGAGMALSWSLYLRDRGLPSAGRIILFSPWVDVSTNHPAISDYDWHDPLLSQGGAQSLGTLWAGGRNQCQHPYVSPILGDFRNLGKISIFVGTHEIFFPDIEQFHLNLTQSGIAHDFIIGEKMFHVYPLSPTPEGRKARQQVISIIREDK